MPTAEVLHFAGIFNEAEHELGAFFQAVTDIVGPGGLPQAGDLWIQTMEDASCPGSDLKSFSAASPSAPSLNLRKALREYEELLEHGQWPMRSGSLNRDPAGTSAAAFLRGSAGVRFVDRLHYFVIGPGSAITHAFRAKRILGACRCCAINLRSRFWVRRLAFTSATRCLVLGCRHKALSSFRELGCGKRKARITFAPPVPRCHPSAPLEGPSAGPLRDAAHPCNHRPLLDRRNRRRPYCPPTEVVALMPCFECLSNTGVILSPN